MPICMRTTLDIRDELLDAAKKRAAKEGVTLTAVVEQALAALVTPRRRRATTFKLILETERGEFIGRIDPANRDALYDLMEGRL